jgi:hypothetical protein
MEIYLKNLMYNALNQHLSRVDNIGPINNAKSMRNHINKHVPRGKVVSRLYDLIIERNKRGAQHEH